MLGHLGGRGKSNGSPFAGSGCAHLDTILLEMT